MDLKMGLLICLLYGKYKKLDQVMFNDIDLLVFDIQDVGVCFYIYISILYYVFEVVVEQGIEVIVLDCFNFNGCYVDGLL